MTENPIPNKRAVLYCRVSTLEQVKEGNSLQSQERECREFARRNGYEVVKHYEERGESAKTADRTQLHEMLRFLADTKKNNVQAVIVYKLDRLSRNTDDYSALRMAFKRYSIEIKSATEHFENNPAGRFLEGIIANVAQFDNEVRAQRCSDGMRDAVREGRYVWGAPVGYSNVRVNEKATIEQNDMGTHVREAFEMVASGQYPTDEVWRLTRARGLTKKNGEPLSRTYFHNMLRNELYMGWIEKFKERHRGKFAPIVSEELFGKTQAALAQKGHKSSSYRTDNPDFPLRRFVKNPDGQKLTGSNSRGRYSLYAFYRFGSKGKNFPRADFEKQVVSFMNSYSFKKSELEKLRRAVRSRFGEATKENTRKAASLRSRLTHIEEEETLLIKKNLKGIISDSVLKKELQRGEIERMEAYAELAAIESLEVSPEDAIAYAEQYLIAPGTFWEEADFSIRSKLQWFQFPSGIVFNGEKFGTTEICSVFKTKDALAASLSSDVDRTGFEPATPSLQMRCSTN
jgi:site-specific DNA recombinase